MEKGWGEFEHEPTPYDNIMDYIRNNFLVSNR